MWAILTIGLWESGFELIVDPFRLKKQGMIELTTFMLGDVALKYPAAFVVLSASRASGLSFVRCGTLWPGSEAVTSDGDAPRLLASWRCYVN